jgi:hypothetical protein
MKNLKKLMFGLLALVMVFGLVFSLSAFTQIKKGPTVYFKYKGTSFNETDYRSMSNWEPVAEPGEVECGGDNNICILRVDSDHLTGSGSQLDKLDDFFSTQLNQLGDVDTYVNTSANIEAQQP